MPAPDVRNRAAVAPEQGERNTRSNRIPSHRMTCPQPRSCRHCGNNRSQREVRPATHSPVDRPVEDVAAAGLRACGQPRATECESAAAVGRSPSSAASSATDVRGGRRSRPRPPRPLPASSAASRSSSRSSSGTCSCVSASASRRCGLGGLHRRELLFGRQLAALRDHKRLDLGDDALEHLHRHREAADALDHVQIDLAAVDADLARAPQLLRDVGRVSPSRTASRSGLP